MDQLQYDREGERVVLAPSPSRLSVTLPVQILKITAT
jgi:hypothetical protein